PKPKPPAGEGRKLLISTAPTGQAKNAMKKAREASPAAAYTRRCRRRHRASPRLEARAGAAMDLSPASAPMGLYLRSKQGAGRGRNRDGHGVAGQARACIRRHPRGEALARGQP